MRTSYLYILFLLIFSWGCITEYEDAGNGTLVDILAVEGIITNDTTYITLSKGVRLTDQINDLAYVNHAILSVECNDGTQMPSVLVGKGKYMVETRQLNPDKAYRLKILLDGEEYQSEYLTPLFTPEIDSISWKKEALGQPVHICVSTRDPQNQSHYYLWSYKEDWEIMAPLRGNARYIGGKLVWFTEENNRYYCWKSFESNSLSLGSTARLTDNKISELTLAQFNPSDNRFSVLYYIYVRQNMVRKEAHDYYANLKKKFRTNRKYFFAYSFGNEREYCLYYQSGRGSGWICGGFYNVSQGKVY